MADVRNKGLIHLDRLVLHICPIGDADLDGQQQDPRLLHHQHHPPDDRKPSPGADVTLHLNAELLYIRTHFYSPFAQPSDSALPTTNSTSSKVWFADNSVLFCADHQLTALVDDLDR